MKFSETGKAILGEGWISAREFIPGELAKLNAKDIQVFLSDKCNPLFPPYNQSIEQEILVKHAQESDQNEMWIWNKETTKRYFITAMRNEDTCIESSTLETEFEKNWELVKRIDNGILAEVTRGNYSTAGASVMYLITARKV